MALNPETEYPGMVAAATPQYPYGQAQNVSAPGDGTGTPWERALINDLFGFQQALLSRAGVTPSGLADTATVSQYLHALHIGAGANYASVAAMVLDLDIQEGALVTLADYAPGNGSGALFGVVVAGGTGTADGGSYVDLGNGLQWQQNFQTTYISIRQFGASPSAAPAVNDLALSAAMAFAGSKPVFVPPGDYTISDTVLVTTRQTLYGSGSASALVQSATNTPVAMVRILAGSSNATVRDLRIDVNLLATNDESQRGIEVISARRTMISGVAFSSLGWSAPLIHGGVAIHLDMLSDTSAHNNTIRHCTAEGFTLGLHSRGPTDFLTIKGNGLRCRVCIRLERDTIIAAPNTGFALLVDRNELTGVTPGSGVGLEIDPFQLYADIAWREGKIVGNMFANIGSGVHIGRDVRAMELAANAFTGIAASDVVDDSLNRLGFSGVNPQDLLLSLGDVDVRFGAFGTRVESKASGNAAYGGLNTTVSLVGNTPTIPVNARIITVTSNAVNLATPTVSTASVTDGQRLTIVSQSSNRLSFLDNASQLLQGGNTILSDQANGVAGLLELVYVGAVGRWMQTSEGV